MLAGATSACVHISLFNLTFISILNSAQIPLLVMDYLGSLPDEVNPGIIQVTDRLKAIPLTLFPLLTTVTVTALSGESTPALLLKSLSFLFLVDCSFTYLVDQSPCKKDFGG